MDRIREGLTYLRGRRATVDQFRREFSDMLLLGLLGKGYAAAGEWLTVTDAGHRLLADAG